MYVYRYYTYIYLPRLRVTAIEITVLQQKWRHGWYHHRHPAIAAPTSVIDKCTEFSILFCLHDLTGIHASGNRKMLFLHWRKFMLVALDLGEWACSCVCVRLLYTHPYTVLHVYLCLLFMHLFTWVPSTNSWFLFLLVFFNGTNISNSKLPKTAWLFKEMPKRCGGGFSRANSFGS